MRRARLSRRKRVSVSMRFVEFISSSERSGSKMRSSRRARPRSMLKPSRYSLLVWSRIRSGTASAEGSVMALSDAQPAGEVPIVQQPEERLREALARRQDALVRETREQSPQASGRIDLLSVDDALPFAERQPRAQVQAQAPGAAQRGEPRERARGARPRKHRLRLWCRQVFAQKTRHVPNAPANPPGNSGGMLHHPFRDLRRAALRLRSPIRVGAVEGDAILEEGEKFPG